MNTLNCADGTQAKFPALTGVRAVAAYMVYFHHYPVRSFGGTVFNLQREMHVGVTVFYVLSGFLIAYRYGRSSQLHSAWLKTYFINRFARIYPVYFVLLVPTLLLGNASVRSWVLNLTLLKGFFDSAKFSGIPQSWSLTVEECFYAIAPCVFAIKQRAGSLLPALAATCVVSILEVISKPGL